VGSRGRGDETERRGFMNTSMITRRTFLAGTAGALVAAVAPATSLKRQASAAGVYTVVSGPLNLRTGPGLGHGVIASLPIGTHVEFIESSGWADGFNWVKVWVGSVGATGFVASEFISKSSTPGGHVFPVGSEVVTTAAVNLRSGAGLGHGVIVTLWVGAPLTVTGAPVASGGYTWYPVRTGYGTNGWVAGAFLKAGSSSPVFPVGSSVKTTAPLNLRSGAGLGHGVIVTLWKGAPLTVTSAPVAADGYSWYQVRTGYGTIGWVAGAFLTW
jgi:N-acetylmuramoyl-L-alanine amidase